MEAIKFAKCKKTFYTEKYNLTFFISTNSKITGNGLSVLELCEK